MDQGPNFESQLFKELCSALGIAKIRTSPYEARSNGVTERFYLTLNAMLAKCVRENQRDWDTHLQPVMAAYRASKHSTTTLSPNMIVFGRESIMPAESDTMQPELVSRTREQRGGVRRFITV